jgi:hypothetical protein
MRIPHIGLAGTLAVALVSLPLAQGAAQTREKFVLGLFGSKPECESKLKQIQKTGNTNLQCLPFHAESPYRFVLWKISEGYGQKPPERLSVLETEKDCASKAVLHASAVAKSVHDAQFIGQTYVRGNLTVQGTKFPVSWNFLCLPAGMNP